MRKVFLLIAWFACRDVLACDAPRGVALDELHHVTACGYLPAAVAANESGAFAAWHLSHAGFGMANGTNFGAPLDGNGRLAIAAQLDYGGGLGRPIIATDDRDFLLVTYFFGTTDARVVRADGTKTPSISLTSSGIGAFNTPAISGDAFAVWTGSSYLIVTTEILKNADGTFRSRVSAVPVSSDGTAGAINVIADDAEAAGLASAGNGRALVLWHRGNTVEAAFVTGVTLSSSPIRLDGVRAPLSIAAGEHGFLVADASTAIRLDDNAVPNGARIGLATDGATPQVVRTGDEYLLAWSTSSNAIRAARVTASGVLSAPFDVGTGRLWSASSANARTILVYGTSCLAVASRTVSDGSTIASEESAISIVPAAQVNPQLIATPAGHQVSWFENGVLLTRFLSDDGSLGDIVPLSDVEPYHRAMIEFENGSVIVWDAHGAGLKFAKLDAFGEVKVRKTIAASAFVFSISIASTGHELLIITSGEDDLFKYQVYATRVDATGNVIDRVLLSNPGEDGFDAIAGVRGEHWQAAWRNGAKELVAIEMDRDGLRRQTRHDLTVPTPNVAFLSGITGGDDPALIWWDYTDHFRLHTTFLADSADVVVAETPDFLYGVRVRGNAVYWNQTGSTSRILSAPVSKDASTPRERACIALPGIALEFAARGDSVTATTYGVDSRIYIQSNPEKPPRRRAARH